MMLVYRAQREAFDTALAVVNELFDGNVCFRRSPEFVRADKNGASVYRMTLTVKNSGAAGGRRSENGRRVAAACWHVYGAFFDNLPESAVICAHGKNTRPGAGWRDWDYMPYSDRIVLMSTLCECGSSWRPSHGAVCNS